MVRKNTTPKDVYDFIYSLDFIKSKYSLRFQNAEVEKLSPWSTWGIITDILFISRSR